MQVTVSELLVRYLERLGVEVIFGMPGAHVLPIYDRLYDARIRTVLVKHEQGAAFMAGGYARVSHRVAACIATAGPGATNLVTGIANAYAERQPVLAITGETPTYIFGKGGLQESSGEGGAIDQAALFASITRYRKLIERTDYLGQVLNQATRALLGPEPGPVLLSIPYNVQKEKVAESVLDGVHFPGVAPARPMADDPVPALAALLRAADCPVMVAGYGCIRAGARAHVARLAERLGIAVATSLKGKGAIAEDAPLALGCLGVTSDGAAYRYLVEHADLVLFLGAGYNERTSYLWDERLLAGKRVVQIDHDAAQLGKVYRPDLAIHGDLANVLERLLALPAGEDATLAEARLARLKAYRRASHGARTTCQAPARGGIEDDVRFRLIRHFYAALAARFPRDALIFDDNIVFAQSFLRVSHANHYFPNGGISSLGHAIPAAIGARLHAHGGAVFAVLGDGGFQMCCMELMTAVNYGIPLNVVVINNGSMGLIRKNQYQLYEERYLDCDFVNPDFAHLAAAFGIRHHRLDSEAAIDTLFAQADLENAINLIEIPLDKHAFPSYLSGR